MLVLRLAGGSRGEIEALLLAAGKSLEQLPATLQDAISKGTVRSFPSVWMALATTRQLAEASDGCMARAISALHCSQPELFLYVASSLRCKHA